MNTHRLTTATIACLLAVPALPALANPPAGYPVAKPIEHADDYHGTQVKDPYRWLEEYTDPTNAWIEAQNRLTFSYLETIPQRPAIRRRLTQLWDYEKYGVPFKEGGRYFYTRNDGLQNQSVLYWLDAIDASPRVLLDLNALSKDGTMALAASSVSHDGQLLAYAIAEAGSDWITWRVREVTGGKDRPDELRWCKFSDASWTKDNQGFYYSRFDAPAEGKSLKDVNEFHKIYYHKLGTEQTQDRLAYERKDQPRWYLMGNVTDDGEYLIINVEPGAKSENGIFYKKLDQPDAPVVELLNKFDAHYAFIGNGGPVFWIMSDLDAPRWRVWAIDLRNPSRKHWKELIPQGDHVLEQAGVVGQRFFCSYLKDASSQMRIYDLSGKPVSEVSFPTIGSAYGFSGKRDDTETFYAFTGYTTPPIIYRYDIAAGKSAVFKSPKLPFDPALYETRQIFARSKDGTRVPIFVSAKKGLQLDGRNPTLLSGYGGFNISNTPGFSPSSLAWMEMGGVYAVATLRGGGEYGEAWHKAGMLHDKQHVFDDFIAAAEHLIAQKYTSTPRLAIEGRSNGGLLVGACLNQRPDLYGAAVPGVGVMDMLRFSKFTIGWGWIGEYGDASKPEDFPALFAYSPYHNIKPEVCYPPVLITTADHDDRVYPAHSFKYAAALQAAQAKVPDCTHPILVRIETRAGHGAGKPTSKKIEQAADELAFLVKSLNMQVKTSSSSEAKVLGGQ